jgi:hypothetical protein
MAKKPPGETAGSNRVTFTQASAARIADVVRTVEQGNRDSFGVVTAPRGGASGAKVFRICAFTGNWSIGATKTIRMQGSTSTLSAVNLFATIGGNTATAAWPGVPCAVAKDGSAWYLIAARCQ